jgi:urea carboxylase-associated protein 1
MSRMIIPAGDGWLEPLPAGQSMTITDLEGNQAVDTVFWSLADTGERYDACRTLTENGRLYLTLGSRLMSNRGRLLATITADTCGRHDTIGGACSCESNQVRYALEKRHMHACRETYLRLLATSPHAQARGLTKRDITHNINFFMNVPVTPAGGYTFDDGISAPGKLVTMRAEVDLLVLISNCPQLNNPCNGWNPTPVAVEVA